MLVLTAYERKTRDAYRTKSFLPTYFYTAVFAVSVLDGMAAYTSAYGKTSVYLRFSFTLSASYITC